MGTELVTGQVQDLHTMYVGRYFKSMGIQLAKVVLLPDCSEDIKRVLNDAIEDKYNIILTLGGLGPTSDDLTRDIISEVTSSPLVWHEQSWNDIQKRLKGRASESNRNQAFYPDGFTVVSNEWGTAPGFHRYHSDQLLISLPGPPSEFHPLFEGQIMPLITKLWPKNDAKSDFPFSCFLIPESEVEDSLKEMVTSLMTWSTIASEGHIKVTLHGEYDNCNKVFELLKDKYGSSCVRKGHDTIINQVFNLCLANKIVLAGAESCTGGLVAKEITDLPGSSQILSSSQVVYSNEAKNKLLGVPFPILDKFGAVSEETIIALLNGLKEQGLGNCFYAVSGIAGPGGATENKPVGTVFIGVMSSTGAPMVYRFQFSGDRGYVRKKTAITLYFMIENLISGKNSIDRLMERPYI